MDPTATSFLLSDHACRRAQQRGVRTDVLRLLLEHADLHLHAGNGCMTLRISERQVRALIAEGRDRTTVARARSLAAVVHGGTVVTVFHQASSRRPNGHRRPAPRRRG